MLSEPPNRRDLRAASVLVQRQRETGVSDRQRARLLAMQIIAAGPPYELTERGRRLLAGVVLLVAASSCGGEPFALAPDAPDAGDVPTDVAMAIAAQVDAGDVSPARTDGGRVAPADAAPNAVDASPAKTDGGTVALADAAGDALLAVDGERDAATNNDATDARMGSAFDAAPDVIAVTIDAGAPDVSTAEDSGSADVAPLPLDANCGAQFSFPPRYVCMCETPQYYSCYSGGTICGSCAPQVAGDPFGHEDGACSSPNVCRVGTPCDWQSPAGYVVHGSVVSCP